MNNEKPNAENIADWLEHAFTEEGRDLAKAALHNGRVLGRQHLKLKDVADYLDDHPEEMKMLAGKLLNDEMSMSQFVRCLSGVESFKVCLGDSPLAKTLDDIVPTYIQEVPIKSSVDKALDEVVPHHTPDPTMNGEKIYIP